MKKPAAPSNPPTPAEAGLHLSKGQASRETILLVAARLVTVRGLAGLSIGDLAAEVGMSKSGLYAHFKSKEELELATIETAAQIFDREVLQPALKAPAGVARLRALAEAFLSHVERQVFPGGCFFFAVATELDTRPGPARDRVAQSLQGWLGLFRQCLSDAVAQGEIHPATDIPQAIFETESQLVGANFLFMMTGDAAPLNQARKGIDQLLARLGADSDDRAKKGRRRQAAS